MLTLTQKIVLGLGAVAALLVLTAPSSSAATGPTPSGGPAPGGGGGAGAGGNVTTPNPGDKMLVVTTDTGPAGRLYIRSAPGTASPQVAMAAHGETLIATGQAQAASDGTTWFQVRNSAGIVGWSESNYLQDMGQ